MDGASQQPAVADGQAPDAAQNAVLKPSEFATDGAQQISGVDFNNYADRDITVAELVESMANMGFQATSVGEASRLINEMVIDCVGSYCASTNYGTREHGKTKKMARSPRYS